MVSLLSILFAITSPTAGAIPKPCPENPAAIYRPSMLGTLSSTGSASGVKSKRPPQIRQIGVCETKDRTEQTEEIARAIDAAGG